VAPDRQESNVNLGSTNTLDQADAKPNGSLADYLALARFDHSTKHIFIVPGIVLAYLLRGGPSQFPVGQAMLGLITAICIASANYVINEYLDREFDKHHPTKSHRRAVERALRGNFVALEWVVFVLIGLSCAWIGGTTLFVTACIFALQGIVYNVRPFRSKEIPYWDVISESINNPLRLTIGWAMIDQYTLPPSSIILAYWFGGAFLMAAKRYSEYREIVASHGTELLIRYRASFAGYSETSLNISCFVYGLLSTFFLAIFLIKYRVEYLLLVPVIIALFGYYLALSTKPASSAQNPEKLFREPKLIALVAILAALFVVATYVDMPALSVFTGQQYITLQ
jgi:4-hydroxybenzoate polyprenyltransferase